MKILIVAPANYGFIFLQRWLKEELHEVITAEKDKAIEEISANPDLDTVFCFADYGKYAHKGVKETYQSLKTLLGTGTPKLVRLSWTNPETKNDDFFLPLPTCEETIKKVLG